MNFIAACLLYHSDEIIAFGLFDALLNDYGLREVYTSELVGLFKHARIMEAILSEKLPDLYEHFMKYEIKAENYVSDWMIGLFASTMPVTIIHRFFNLFFKEGWTAIYKIIFLILR